MVQFDPLINLGFVPVGTKKMETIQFLNDGAQTTRIDIKSEYKREDLKLDTESIILPAYDPKKSEDKRKQCIILTFEPTETMNLHEKFEVIQVTGEKTKDLGYIEVIATSVIQQMSIVFEEGGGQSTDVDFGLLYHGQKKECSAFLVNNGPKEMSYKFFFHPGKDRKDISNADEDDFANTPQEAGLEMTQRILSAYPTQGFIKPYSQIPIKFLCNTKIKESQKGWRVTLCPEYDQNSKNQNKNLRELLSKDETFQSLAAVKFEEAFINKLAMKDTEEDFCKPVTVYMKVRAVLPDITIDKTSLNFWECNLKEKKVISITITNKNDELPIDFSFNKIPHFTVEPSHGIIKPGVSNINSQMTVQVFFHPENIGKFADVLVFKYVNNMYSIPIRIFGVCKGKSKIPQSIGNTTAPLTKGNLSQSVVGKSLNGAQIVPDELAQDFTEPKRKRIDQNAKIQKLHQHRLDEVLSKIQSVDDITGQTKGINPANDQIKNFEENFKVYNQIFNHKAKANAELVKMRKERMKKKMEHIIIDQGSSRTSVDDLLCLRGNRLDSPRLALPQPQDQLWVIKPVGNYEPVYLEETAMKEFTKSQDELPETSDAAIRGSSKTGEIPRTHQEIRECKLELSGEDLQKIQVCPKDIKMGQVFLKSEKGGTFWVKNNHRNHIFVKLEIDSNMPDLMRTYPKSHVIAPGEIQGFRVIVWSTQVRNAVYPVKYTINYKHVFKLRVSADIIKVKLDIQNTLTKFQFKNDKISEKEGKIEMSLKQKLKLFNDGNSNAVIRWQENKEKAFIISPMEMEVRPGQDSEVSITFNPFAAIIQKDNYKYTDELIMNIENGDSKKFTVEGVVQPCVVKFFNLEEDTVDFEMIHTGIENVKKFHLKNETSRVITAYQIQNDFPETLDFKDSCGYLADKAKEIEVILKRNEPDPDFKVEVPILIRGAPKLILKIKANIVQPEVTIEEESFEFGGVSLNESATKTLTFVNNSQLEAKVNVNMNAENIYRDFKLILPEAERLKRPHAVIPLEKENKEEVKEEEEEENEAENKNEEEDEEDRGTEDLREFQVIIPPGEKIPFDFIFTPASLEHNNYEFDINFELVGASSEYKGLKRHVTGSKMSSVIHISEMHIKFPDTFIYENANNFKTKTIYLGGVGGKALHWEFILNEDLINQGVFDVKQKNGDISAKDSSGVQVEFTFTPHQQGECKGYVVLKVTYDENKEIFKTITLQGIGLRPRLYFDKRELILPIVPLGFESSIKFKVKNKGYENEEIRCQLETYPQGTLPLEVVWLQKNHSVGYNVSELKLELKMISYKPITFTTKLIFYDKEGQQFPILVAGTSDNCLFTNYSFFQRTDKSTYDFISDNVKNTINLRKLEEAGDDDDLNNSKISKDDKKNDKESSVGSMKGSVTLGYAKIQKSVIDHDCKILKKYIKKIHLDDAFLQATDGFKTFPDDLVKNNGKAVYVLIKNLIGKEPPGRITGELSTDALKRANQIREQYFQLLRFLQECGACLNTVFPEYLMSFDDCKKYIQGDKKRENVLAPKWDKDLMKEHNYYHRQSWILLIYQILKIFYLARVNTRSFQTVLKNLPDDIRERYSNVKFGPSNVYSQSEYILLRWLQACSENVNPSNPKEPINFSSDFVDSSLLTALILSYFPKEDTSKKNRPGSEIRIMAYPQLIPILQKYGIYTHIKKISGDSKPNVTDKYVLNSREMVLFLSMLFQNFQYFYPKDNIKFECILGESVTKSITLYNPTNKPLEYSVKFEADDCFKPPEGMDAIRIEPLKDAEYQIRFDSKISTPVEGKVYFINKKSGWANQAAPIVYTFCSSIKGRKSLDSKILSTTLYSKFAYRLLVKNPFMGKEKEKIKPEFNVRLEQRIKTVNKKKGGGKKINDSSELYYKVFTLKNGDDFTSVKFGADGQGEIMIYFLPVELKTYECNVIFINEKIGEFQYTIEGRVERPYAKKSEFFERVCNVDEVKEFELEIKLKNPYLERAVDELSPIEDAKIFPDTKPGEKTEERKVTKKILQQKLLPDEHKMAFAVETNKPYFIVPPTISPGLNSSPSNEKQSQGANTSLNQSVSNPKEESMYLKVKFTSKACMLYEGDITLKNMYRENDIRVYKLYVDVKPKVIRATLEFYCPVKEVITQKIPIENKSDKDWLIKGELTGQHNGFFKHESDKRIPKHSITDYLLTFAPTEKKNCSGLLKLTNNFTSETYFYTLSGIVEDPLASGNIEITGVNAKETHKKSISFTNESDTDITYTVETDLDEIISGVPSFTIPAGQEYSYEMKIRPLLGKIYFGRIIFRDDRKNYLWYTIRVEAKSQVQTQTIEMKTKIRKGVMVNIKLENPINEPCIFGIDFDSDLYLFGEKDVRVDANSTKDYTLLYAPLKVGIWDNVMLHIYNDKIGEYLYKLKLICEDSERIVSDLQKAELGKYCDFSCLLENPTQDEIEIKYTNSNPKLFQVLLEKITVPSGIQREVLVRYTPSCLGSDEECEIVFSSNTIGNWKYVLRGRGIPPQEMDTTYVRTFVGGMTSGQITFRNPLNEKTTITIELPFEDDTFTLFTKKKSITLEPFRPCLISFTFKPKILAKYTAKLFVRISKTLFWTYPIEGITEVKSKGIDFVFKTKAKQILNKIIELDLSSLPDQSINYEDFSYVLNIKEDKYRSLIQKCLSIAFVDKKGKNGSNISTNKIVPLEVKFYPLRPFKTDIEFVLRKKTGGQWIYNIILESLECEPDDIINIKSSLGKKSLVTFRLQNVFTKEAKFIAYFS
ncbi:MAG: hypothetical protein MJ252_01695, partial [archaeon]|nr:hypothetical protein [archaeon]